MQPSGEFEKVLRIGTIPHWRENAKPIQVYAKVSYRAGRLSVTGVEGPKANGDAHGSCGQIEMHYRTPEERAAITPAPNWTAESVGAFFDAWDRWHLNDMQAGSPRQMEHLRKHRSEYAAGMDHYAWAKETLARAGIQPDTEYLRNGEPYSYGSAWITEEIPAQVLAYFRALPDTDYSPAWI